jgi:SnoaL-like domain
MANETARIAATYFDAWKANDLERLRSVLADDVEFSSPLAHLDSADECIEGIRELAEVTTDIVVNRRVVDGEDILTFFDLHTATTEPVPITNWSHVEDGKITQIRVAFNPRPALAAAS